MARRTNETGIRIALGAQGAQVMRLSCGMGLLLGAAGIALGLAGAAAVPRLLQGAAVQAPPLDPATFLAVALPFACVTALASYVPARRTTRVDPIMALSSEYAAWRPSA